ncbi:MAG: sulfatase-like hydrolase/transferase [Planctomycetes bacterium]|nr:sulfatase-like hydrolase/transferase [Planctomycetota bacterium]
MTMQNQSILVAVACVLTFLAADAMANKPRPNILWLSCEDISPHISCYGDPHAITPNIDRLATEGVRFTHAFTTAGVCAPCRSGIITGLYQTTLGTHHMRCTARLPKFIKPFPVYLRQAGYYCTNNSKKDYQFSAPRETWDESSGKAHWRKRKQKDQPFFAVFNFTGCHESGIASKTKYQAVTRKLTRAERQDAAVCEIRQVDVNFRRVHDYLRRRPMVAVVRRTRDDGVLKAFSMCLGNLPAQRGQQVPVLESNRRHLAKPRIFPIDKSFRQPPRLSVVVRAAQLQVWASLIFSAEVKFESPNHQQRTVLFDDEISRIVGTCQGRGLPGSSTV